MAAVALFDLATRLDGWTVEAVITYETFLEIRVSTPIEGAPNCTRARAVLFAEGRVPAAVDRLVGSSLSSSPDQVRIGSWDVPSAALRAGQVLETAIIVVPRDVDAARRPDAAAAAVLESGSLVWPPIEDLPDPYCGLDLLAGITRVGFMHPLLLTTVEVQNDAGHRIHDAFLTPWAAIEVARATESGGLVSVSYFPLSDVPSRLLERCGLAPLLSAGGARPDLEVVDVTVRSTFLDQDGLAVGGLAWNQASDGSLMTDSGSRTALSLACELMSILPGASQGPVGER